MDFALAPAAVQAPPARAVWPLALTAVALALFLIAATVGAVVLFAGKRPEPVVVVTPPPAAAPNPIDPVPPPLPSADLSPRTDDHSPSLPPTPPEKNLPPAPSDPLPPPADPPVLTPPPADSPPPLRPPARPAPPADPPPAPPIPPPTPPPDKPRLPADPPPAPVGFQRRDQLSEEDLRKQLLKVPELALDTPGNIKTATALFEDALLDRVHSKPYPGPGVIVGRRPDLDGLPLVTGADAELSKEAGETLQTLSRTIRDTFSRAVQPGGADPQPNAEQLRKQLLGVEAQQWLKPEAVPCLLQMLQPEDKPIRQILVEALGRIKGQRATAALAMRAITDLSPEVRQAAVKELRARPLADSRPVLLHGLRYLVSACSSS